MSHKSGYDKLIERLSRYSEPVIAYKLDADSAAAIVEAVAALKDLPIENQVLRNAANGFKAELARVTAERDAAVGELRGKCSACAHYTPYHNDGPCASCKFEIACFVPEKATDKWAWRGIKKED